MQFVIIMNELHAFLYILPIHQFPLFHPLYICFLSRYVLPSPPFAISFTFFCRLLPSPPVPVASSPLELLVPPALHRFAIWSPFLRAVPLSLLVESNWQKEWEWGICNSRNSRAIHSLTQIKCVHSMQCKCHRPIFKLPATYWWLWQNQTGP